MDLRDCRLDQLELRPLAMIRIVIVVGEHRQIGGKKKRSGSCKCQE
jgi:hypothetical protein